MDKISQLCGKLAAVLIFLLLLICVFVVVLRYGFSMGSIALQEAMIYCHGAAFLLALAYTLQQDEHVRVDIFYQHFSPQQKAWVNALGIIFLSLPFCAFTAYFGAQFFLNALAIEEASAEAGGLAFVYLLKGLIPLSMILLLGQNLRLLISACRQLFHSPAASEC
jgi:TRAP-type mannitol/chloroaromatic compound transport system permease small subunit